MRNLSTSSAPEPASKAPRPSVLPPTAIELQAEVNSHLACTKCGSGPASYVLDCRSHLACRSCFAQDPACRKEGPCDQTVSALEAVAIAIEKLTTCSFCGANVINSSVLPYGPEHRCPMVPCHGSSRCNGKGYDHNLHCPVSKAALTAAQFGLLEPHVTNCRGQLVDMSLIGINAPSVHQLIDEQLVNPQYLDAAAAAAADEFLGSQNESAEQEEEEAAAAAADEFLGSQDQSAEQEEEEAAAAAEDESAEQEEEEEEEEREGGGGKSGSRKRPGSPQSVSRKMLKFTLP